MSGGKIAMIVIGSVLALVGLIALAVGGTLVAVNFTERDAAGYYTTPTIRLSTPTYAFTSNVDLGASTNEGDWVPVHVLGTVQIRAAAPDGAPVFVGIGPRAAIDRWLTGVAHAHVSDVKFSPFRVTVQPQRGSLAPAGPVRQAFWVASASGPGTQTLRWPTQGGDWSAVIMNADASRGVRVSVSVGANTGILLPIGAAALAFAVVVLAVSLVLIILGARRERSAAVAPGPPDPYRGGRNYYATAPPPPTDQRASVAQPRANVGAADSPSVAHRPGLEDGGDRPS